MNKCLLGSALLLTALVANAEEKKPFYLTLEPPPAPELTPEQALSSFAIAPGFRIELAAAEPVVEDPVAITWDEDGRMYAVEMRGFMPDSYGTGEKEPIGTIVRLTDTDHDGYLDQREVVLDKLVLPRAVAVVNEGLLVAEPPNLWLCPSKTGLAKEIDCSKKWSLGNYGDQPGSVEHAENGLLMGLDNWLYNAKSERRMRLQNGKLAVEPTLFRGQWGITQDNFGRLFYNTNSNLLSGDFYSAQYVIAAGSRGAPGLNARVHVNDEMFSIRVNPGVNRAYVPGVLKEDGRLRGPTSAAGMVVYRGHQFPTSDETYVFTTESAANAVAQLRLAEDGLAIDSEHVLYPDEKWGQREFMASTDERFRPVNASVGPDGALYIVDMYRGIIQDHVFLTDQLRAQALERKLDRPTGLGRIWRVVSTTNTIDYAPPKLSSASNKTLIEMLGHKNGWHRDTAQRLLIGRQDDALKTQLIKTTTSKNMLQAIHSLWTLAGRNEIDRDTVIQALESQRPAVSHAALQAGELLLTTQDLLASTGVQDPAIKQQLVFSLGRHNRDHKVQDALLGILHDELKDVYRRTAVQASLRGVELAFVRRLISKNTWTQAQEQSTGLIKALT
ncbi:MAG: cytochrome c, class I, partial [Pseudomonadota bacterium]